MKYRKKTIVTEVIEAIRWYGKLTDETEWPHWFRQKLGHGIRIDANTTYPKMVLVIITPEKDMRANPGDYIVRDSGNNIYPCKPHIFEAIYEEIT